MLAATSLAVLQAVLLPLLSAGLAALVYGIFFMLWSLGRQPKAPHGPADRAFSLPYALGFAALLGTIIVVSAWLSRWLGGLGTLLAAAFAGLVDTHAASISVAALVPAGRLPAGDAVIPILAAFSTNTFTKILAALKGGRPFALAVVPGLLLVVAAAWAGALVPW